MIGIGTGASVPIGQACGARETHKVKAIAGTAFALVLGVAIAFTRTALQMNLVVTGGLVVLGYLLSRHLPGRTCMGLAIQVHYGWHQFISMALSLSQT